MDTGVLYLYDNEVTSCRSDPWRWGQEDTRR